nr:hypothetical protein GCM10020092_000300 [Actinoplanes digitatis]
MTAEPRLRSARSAPVQPGYAPGEGLMRLPAFWVVLALLVTGGVRMTMIAGRFAGTYPVATMTAIALFALLAVPFWLVVTELDFLEREPPALLVLAFAWGGLVATTVSLPGSAALDDLIAKLGSPHLAADWGAALAQPDRRGDRQDPRRGGDRADRSRAGQQRARRRRLRRDGRPGLPDHRGHRVRARRGRPG